MTALNRLRESLTENDNLLVYYAGHGRRDEAGRTAYWQPVDAEPDNTANWISSLEVSDILLDIPARRVLVVADSCFSGAFLESADAVEVETASAEQIAERLDQRARLALSSGSLQPVIDNGADGHSVFSRALLATLESRPSAIDSAALFQEVRAQVDSSTRALDLEQTPRFAPLDSDAGGVFLFVPTGNSV